MPGWDENSPRLRRNLDQLLRRIRDNSRRRMPLTLDTVRQWHVDAMEGLDVTVEELGIGDRRLVGAFRGEPGLETIGVKIGRHDGVHPAFVADQLDRLEDALGAAIGRLDRFYPPGAELDEDGRRTIVEFCAMMHAEWVRIHPLANGNGRVARLLVNAIAARYGLPQFVNARPRPNGGYAEAGEQAMVGNWRPTAEFFWKMFNEAIDDVDEPPPDGPP